MKVSTDGNVAKNIFEELYKNHDEDYNINTKDFEKKLK